VGEGDSKEIAERVAAVLSGTADVCEVWWGGKKPYPMYTDTYKSHPHHVQVVLSKERRRVRVTLPCEEGTPHTFRWVTLGGMEPRENKPYNWSAEHGITWGTPRSYSVEIRYGGRRLKVVYGRR
jgi:hypothetical protein